MWRKLRALGVVQVLDGLVALPADARTREQLDWVADEVLDAGGEATVWLGHLGSAAQEHALATRMAQTVTDEYEQVIASAAVACGEPDAARRRILARLRRELRRVNQRDFFPPPQREAARRAVQELASTVEVAP